MSKTQTSPAELTRSRLRVLVARIEQRLALVSKNTTHPQEIHKEVSTNDLLVSWAELVELLALGPEPEMKECPYCQQLCMKAATLCMSCWARIPANASA